MKTFDSPRSHSLFDSSCRPVAPHAPPPPARRRLAIRPRTTGPRLNRLGRRAALAAAPIPPPPHRRRQRTQLPCLLPPAGAAGPLQLLRPRPRLMRTLTHHLPLRRASAARPRLLRRRQRPLLRPTRRCRSGLGARPLLRLLVPRPRHGLGVGRQQRVQRRLSPPPRSRPPGGAGRPRQPTHLLLQRPRRKAPQPLSRRLPPSLPRRPSPARTRMRPWWRRRQRK